MNITQEIANALKIPLEKGRKLTDTEHASLYATAHSLYEQGNYPVALMLFTHLVVSSPFCERSWRGLAATRQMQQDFNGSLHAWALTALLQDKDPFPHFHAAECYFSLKEPKEALQALDAAEALLSGSEEDRELKNKISLLREAHATVYTST